MTLDELGLFLLGIALAGFCLMMATAPAPVKAPRPSSPGAQSRPAPVRTYAFGMQGDVLPAEDNYSLAPYSVQAAPKIPTYYVETQAPGHVPTVATGFTIPALQAIGTAIALTLAVGVLAVALRWPAKVVGITFALSLSVGWFWRLGLADKLLWKLETWSKRDLDGDGVKGQPAGAYLYNPAQARATAGKIAEQAQRDDKADELVTFYRQCATLGTSEAKLGISPTPSARGAYCEKRDILIALGVAGWKDANRPRLGWSLLLEPDAAVPILRKHLVSTN